MGFLRVFSIALVANFILFVLSFLNNKLIYLVLSPEENGVYFLTMRFSLLVYLFFGEWIRLTNMNIAGSNKSLTPVLSANVTAYTGLIGILLLSCAALFPQFLGFCFPGLPAYCLVAVIITGLCIILRSAFQSLLLVNNRMFWYGAIFVLWGGIFLLLDVVFLCFYHLGLNAVIFALMISSALAALAAFFSNTAYHGLSFRPSLKIFTMSGKMGIRAAFAVFGMYIMINIHAFAIGPLTGGMGESLAIVGMFSVSFRVYQLFQRGSDITGTILFANVAQNGEKKGYRITSVVCRNIFASIVFFGIIACLLGKQLILIISDSKFLGAYLPLLFMMPGIVFMNTGTILNSSYWGRGYPFKVIVAPYVAAALGFAMDMIFIPGHGATGAALAFSCMSFLWFMYIILVFRSDSGFHISKIIIPHYEDFLYLLAKIRHKFSW